MAYRPPFGKNEYYDFQKLVEDGQRIADEIGLPLLLERKKVPRRIMRELYANIGYHNIPGENLVGSREQIAKLGRAYEIPKLVQLVEVALGDDTQLEDFQEFLEDQSRKESPVIDFDNP